MSTFLQMRTKIATDLRRGNLDTEIGVAVNDAIAEAAKRRFYFNEMHVSFPTVNGTEYYPDMGLVELDAVWYMQGSGRQNVAIVNQIDANIMSSGNNVGGALQYLSRYGGQLRLWPIPSVVDTIYVDGYGKLTPNPLAADGDTNAWLTEGELYIRALAKRNILRDVIRDYGEAKVLEAIAEDYASQLDTDTTLRSSEGTLVGTQF